MAVSASAIAKAGVQVSDEQGYPAGCPMCADLKTEAGKAAFALTIGWPLPEELIAYQRHLARENERIKALEAALRELCNAIDHVCSSPEYLSVWTISQLHYGPYSGPTFVAQFEAARAALESK